MSEVLTPVAFQLGTGGIGGFLAGYAVKKVAKLLAVVVGFYVLSLLYLSHVGVISVNYEKLEKVVSGLLGVGERVPTLFIAIVSYFPFAASFTAAFVLGWQRG